MQLQPTGPHDTKTLRRFVESASVVTIHHVITGRNAWHSTWSTQYSEGSVHSTIDAATEFAETKRVQGTVFEVLELPALALSGDGCTLVVLELNEKSVFSRLDVRRLQDLIAILEPKSMTLQQFAMVFRASSPLWSQNYPQRNSIVFRSAASTVELAPLDPTCVLQIHQSRPDGPDFPLSWTPRESKVTSGIISSVGQMISKRISGTRRPLPLSLRRDGT